MLIPGSDALAVTASLHAGVPVLLASRGLLPELLPRLALLWCGCGCCECPCGGLWSAAEAPSPTRPTCCPISPRQGNTTVLLDHIPPPEKQRSGLLTVLFTPSLLDSLAQELAVCVCVCLIPPTSPLLCTMCHQSVRFTLTALLDIISYTGEFFSHLKQTHRGSMCFAQTTTRPL